MIESITELISLLIALAALTISIFTYRQNVIHNRRINTLNAFNVLQEQVLDSLYRYTATEIIEISQHPKAERYKEISVFLARVEHFCVGVNTGVYDKDMVRSLAGKHLVELFKKLRPVIDKKRAIGKDELMFRNFEMVVKT